MTLTYSTGQAVTYSGGAAAPARDSAGIPETTQPTDPRAGDSDQHADAGMQAAHMAFLDLFKYSDSTHWVRQTGNWSDASTWSGGRIPGDNARVIIQAGFVVTYDVNSTARIKTLLVDGTLNFATASDTKLMYETWGIGPAGDTAPKGILNIATTDPTVTTELVMIDEGALDFAADPQLMGRGFISHGTVSIEGATKASFSRLTAAANATDTTFAISSVDAATWRVGDTVVVAEGELGSFTRIGSTDDQTVVTKEEVVTITDITSGTVTFTPAFAHDHFGPSGRTVHAANLTRNVKFYSESDTARGHTMFMHSDDVVCKYAEFKDLGRTDKSVGSIPPANATSNTSNVRGRYPVHVHRSGFGGVDVPRIQGCAVWGSPSWGFTHHDSHAEFWDNASYDCFGAGFVSETNNETGTWLRNISIRTPGSHRSIKETIGTFDMWRSGTPFGSGSRGVVIQNCVATGSPNSVGFAWNVRSTSQVLSDFKVPVAQLPVSEFSLGLANVDNFEAPIRDFNDNEAYACRVGMEVVKGTPAQHHDLRGTFKNFTAWNVVMGCHIQYTSHYTLQNFDLESVATVPANISSGDHRGIFLDLNAFDQLVNGATIKGFDKGIHLNRAWINPIDPAFAGNHHFVFIDVTFDTVTTNYVNSQPEDIIDVTASLPLVPVNTHGYVSRFSNAPNYFDYNSSSRKYLIADITDGLGTRSIGDEDSPDEFQFELGHLNALMARDGVWTDTASPGEFFLKIPVLYTSDRLTGAHAFQDVIIEVDAVYNPQNHTNNGQL